MKIILSVGHSILKSGACTSADGRPFGGILEYSYNRGIVHQTAEYLRRAGHQVEVLICPEQQFLKSSEERTYKLKKVNAGGYDLAVELHLNSSKYHNARGCEVLYICSEGRRIADCIQKRLGTVFQDRGIKKRNDLYMLNSTEPIALIIESFFCDSAADAALAESADVARLIAEGIHGGEVPKGGQASAERPEEPEFQTGILYRVQAGAFSIKAYAERLRDKLVSLGFQAFVTTADNGRILYRVQVGAFAVKSNALAMKAQLEAAGFEAFLVIA